MSSLSETNSKDRQKWTMEQDQALKAAVARVASSSRSIVWSEVANAIPGKNNKSCRKRWYYKVANNFQKGPWSVAEDEKLRRAVKKYGTKWSKVSEDVKTRNGDQCWKRWHDSLNPEIDHSPWSTEEDYTLVEQVEQLGRRWQDIVDRHFPSRTALGAKNRYALLDRRSKMMLDMGDDYSEPTDKEEPTDTTGESMAQTTDASNMMLTPESIVQGSDFDTSMPFLDFSHSNTLASLDTMDFGIGANRLTAEDGQDDGFMVWSDFSSSETSHFLQGLAAGTGSSPNASSTNPHTEHATPDLFTFSPGTYALSDESAAPTPANSNNNRPRTSSSVTVNLECSSQHLEGVMEKISKEFNDLMITGIVKNVRYAVE